MADLEVRILNPAGYYTESVNTRPDYRTTINCTVYQRRRNAEHCTATNIRITSAVKNTRFIVKIFNNYKPALCAD